MSPRRSRPRHSRRSRARPCSAPRPAGRTERRHGGGRGETALTGEIKQKVEAAVLAKCDGAAIFRTETNSDSSAPYESHIKTSAGKELEVLVSKDFEVVKANERPARP
jgi:hypothetical protein